MVSISVIIPTYNEEDNIQTLLRHLKKAENFQEIEILVSDGGSTDKTKQIIETEGFTCLQGGQKSRAKQLNFGAKHAKGSILYFVHADSLPPLTFVADIKNAIQDGFPIGCYRFKFNSPKKILKVNAYFTRFDRLMCRGGDQSLFITRKIFDELQGYDEYYKIMEDYDIIIRARKKYAFKIIPKDIIVSARKYDHNSYFKVNITNLAVFIMFFLKVNQDKMINFYRKMLNHQESELKY
ncbi:TIGR04283 family arsenosugar biosynthesis glycosyltransferase [Pedobacter puniceum]|uniref:Glycosyltransferase n=1 Tax=Pedobacter puniceum TaxID=2666136 RepID=A0A7K0FK69_9SPHI|nr:TIGR04283 family arsenosugar biosynthesis glycosyltransferase [Pedobacter puniceum]MRX46364.1 glycosyltransferase [Pedobacter puniceum]